MAHSSRKALGQPRCFREPAAAPLIPSGMQHVREDPIGAFVRSALLARRSVLAVVTPGPVMTMAPGRHGRYPGCDCILRAAGMLRPRSPFSPETALMNALAERTGRYQAPVNSPHSWMHPSSAGRPGWPGCADWWIRSRGRARSWSPSARQAWARPCCWRRRRAGTVGGHAGAVGHRPRIGVDSSSLSSLITTRGRS
jgi:hypothetical protein